MSTYYDSSINEPRAVDAPNDALAWLVDPAGVGSAFTSDDEAVEWSLRDGETVFPVELESRGPVVRGVTGPAALADLMSLATTVSCLEGEVRELRRQLRIAADLIANAAGPRPAVPLGEMDPTDRGAFELRRDRVAKARLAVALAVRERGHDSAA